MRHTCCLQRGRLSAMPISALVYASQGCDLFRNRGGAAVCHQVSCDRVRGHLAGLMRACGLSRPKKAIPWLPQIPRQAVMDMGGGDGGMAGADRDLVQVGDDVAG